MAFPKNRNDLNTRWLSCFVTSSETYLKSSVGVPPIPIRGGFNNNNNNNNNNNHLFQTIVHVQCVHRVLKQKQYVAV